MKMRNIDHPRVSEPKTLYESNSLRRLLRWAGDQLNKQETQCSGRSVL